MPYLHGFCTHDSDRCDLVIVSGGQTGADRAALDFALSHAIPHDGWAPRGRLAEDGPLAPKYRLRETPSASYAQRTAWNVRDSDATILFTLGEGLGTGGVLWTHRCADRMRKPLLHLVRNPYGPQVGDRVPACAAALRGFLQAYGAGRLNVAGPRLSRAPGIVPFVRRVLEIALLPASSRHGAAKSSQLGV